MAEHYHGSSGAGLRPRVVEPKYVEALGVLVVSAAGKMTQVHQIWCQLCTKSFQNFSRSKHTIRTPNVVHNCFLPICFVGA